MGNPLMPPVGLGNTLNAAGTAVMPAGASGTRVTRAEYDAVLTAFRSELAANPEAVATGVGEFRTHMEARTRAGLPGSPEMTALFDAVLGNSSYDQFISEQNAARTPRAPETAKPESLHPPAGIAGTVRAATSAVTGASPGGSEVTGAEYESIMRSFQSELTANPDAVSAGITGLREHIDARARAGFTDGPALSALFEAVLGNQSYTEFLSAQRAGQ